MDRTQDTDALRARLIELETALRRPGGISILEERELMNLRAAQQRQTVGRVSAYPRSATPGGALALTRTA